MLNTITFAEMLTAARTRVLTRYAAQATEDASRLRERIALFPDHADELQQRAAEIDEYAAECRATAEDHTLSTPGHGTVEAREHAARCVGRHALNDQADDGTWSTTCVRCGWKVEGYETRAAADAAFLGEEPVEP